MAIDIRANVTCSLGTLISGSISDDYIQGNGLVKTKGQCELQGILTPGIGSVVTFSYTRGGTTHQIPRRLRVLSSFADPFRNITKVELGCKLTYMEGVGPAPTVDGQASYVTGKQQQCLNGWADYPADSKLPIPVSAAGVMSLCLSKLGITASSSPLQNRFSVDKFDLSQGYVPVLGDLLVSESYFGYLDENEVLQVRDLAVEGGGGPVIDSTTLIDLDQIGVGDLPGDAVVVRYDALKLKGTIDTTTAGAAEQRKRDWEEEEVIGDPETHVVRYTNSSGATIENSYVYIPYQKTVTTYGKDDSFDPNVCTLSGRQGVDLSDSPVKVKTTERILMAQAATNYCSEVLSAGLTVDPAYVQEFESKVIENKYDDKGELIETTEYTYEPFYKWAGGLDLQFVYATAIGSESVTLGGSVVLVQKVITKRENTYAAAPAGTYLKPGEELIPVVEAQKVTTTTYTNWALTQQGQQAVAQIKDQTPFTTATQCADWLNANSTALVLTNGQVQINRGRDIVQGQKRAATADRIGGEKGERPESTGQLIYAAGAVGSDRIISMSMPYQSDDTYTRSGTVIRGNAAAMALRYGRTQNRLLMGNRYGVNVQIHPDRMPAHPYDPLYLSNGSLMVQYRANAANWAFSKDGVVASLDALFWGVAGGTGTSWAPVAPGVTTFPPLPTVDGNGNTTVGSVVPPWNETVPMIGTTRTVASIAGYEYSLNMGTANLGVLTTRTKETSLEVIGHDDLLAVTQTLMSVTEVAPPAGEDFTMADGCTPLALGNTQVTAAPTEGWTVAYQGITTGNSADCKDYKVSFGDWLTINGTAINSVDLGTNYYLTFPGGQNKGACYLNTTAIASNKLILSPDTTGPHGGDWYNGIARLICSHVGGNYARFRVEAVDSFDWGGDAKLIYEVTIIPPLGNGTQYIEIKVGTFVPVVNNGVDKDGRIGGDHKIHLATATTDLAVADIAADTCYVFEGNATGTVWTAHPNKHLSGAFRERLGPAVTRTTALYPVSQFFNPAAAYTGDGIARSFDVGAMYPALIWTPRRNLCGMWTMGPGKVFYSFGQSSVTTTEWPKTYTGYSYGGYSIGVQANVNQAAEQYFPVIFGADAPPALDKRKDVPVMYQKAPGMMFMHFTATGTGIQSTGWPLTLPNYLGGNPEYLIYKRVNQNWGSYAGGDLLGGPQAFLNVSTGSGTGPVQTDTTAAYWNGWDANEIRLGWFTNRVYDISIIAFRSYPGVVHCGTFVDNGTNPVVVTGVGFRPRWILMKSLTGSSDHLVFSVNYTGPGTLKWNLYQATPVSAGTLTYDPDGFTFTKLTTTTGQTWFYVAIA